MNIDLDFDVQCNECGGTLNITSTDTKHNYIIIAVDTCQKCWNDAQDEGHEKGFEEAREREYLEGAEDIIKSYHSIPDMIRLYALSPYTPNDTIKYVEENNKFFIFEKGNNKWHEIENLKDYL